MIKATFTSSDIMKYANSKLDDFKSKIILRLQFLGEKCLNECRSNHTYTDQTGNLTSSMGYVILIDGKVHSTKGFVGKGKEGSDAGEKVSQKLIKEAPQNGFVLIVVAGMNYAHYVEAKGYNVLASAEELAAKEMQKMVQKLKGK